MPMPNLSMKNTSSFRPKVLSKFSRINDLNFNEMLNHNENLVLKNCKNPYPDLMTPTNMKIKTKINLFGNMGWNQSDLDESHENLPTVTDSVSTFKSIFSKNDEGNLKNPFLQNRDSERKESRKSGFSAASERHALGMNRTVDHPHPSQFKRPKLLNPSQNNEIVMNKRKFNQGLARKLFSPIVQRNKMPVACTIVGRISQMRVRSPAVLRDTCFSRNVSQVRHGRMLSIN